MSNIELINNTKNELGFVNIDIVDIDKVNDYLFISLSNGQKILTNGECIYDVSEYSHLSNLFYMGDRFCGEFNTGFTLYVVDINTKEVLFEDRNAYFVSKQDDRTLKVVMKIGGGNDTIYDIDTKRYLPAPSEYEFEHSLGNNLYVFREARKDDTSFYDYKRCVINANSKVLMKDIEGWIYLSDNHIIIIKKDEICIVGVSEDTTLDMKTIRKNEDIIAKPTYHDGNIIIMTKGAIKIYTPSLVLVNEILIDELNEVIDYEIVDNTLKLCLPYIESDEQINRHLFVNLSNGKRISHLRIEGYPYWVPTTYIGKDSINDGVTSYHFYNKDFDSIIDIDAKSYDCVDTDRECLFVINSEEDGYERRRLLNTENGSIRETDYDYIKYPVDHPYGYGINFTTKKIDFFDENLEVVVPGFEYEKYNIGIHDFGYFIVNGYLCLIHHYVDGYGISRDRSIIVNPCGETMLDSIKHRCYPLGNFIQIILNKKSEFLNTLTGEIGPLSISTKVDEDGKIDLKGIGNINSILTISNKVQLALPSSSDEQYSLKKLPDNQE